MGAVLDRSVITVSDVKSHLRISGSAEDTILGLMLDSAKAQADAQLGAQTFADVDLYPGGDIPAPIEMWVLEAVARAYTKRENGLASASVPGGSSMTWGPVDYSVLRSYWMPVGL